MSNHLGFDHIGLKVKDIDASVRFYEAALQALDHVLCSHDESSASFGPNKDQPLLWLYSSPDATHAGTHLAFRAANHAAVDRFHQDVLRARGHDNGGPGFRADYSPVYYAAFLLDPDGNNIEAVCMQ